MGLWTKPEDTRLGAKRLEPLRPSQFDVVVFGSEFNDWLPLLSPASELWRTVPRIRSVTLEPDSWQGDGDPAQRLVLPLLERNIRRTPAGWALVPPQPALDVFADKARFAGFISDYGLDAWAPQTLRNAGGLRFPCVLKRTDLWASHGVVLVQSEADLRNCLALPMWAGQPVVLQEYVPATEQTTVHAVAVGGILQWHCAYTFEVRSGEPIRLPRPGEAVRREILSARDLFALQQFIAPLGYSGPLNVDMRRRASGAPRRTRDQSAARRVTLQGFCTRRPGRKSRRHHPACHLARAGRRSPIPIGLTACTSAGPCHRLWSSTRGTVPVERPDRFEIVVFGDRFSDWLAKLAPDAPLWDQIPEVRSVTWRGDDWRGDDIDPAASLVLPLMPGNIRAFRGGWALVPRPTDLELLDDKAAFARYLADHELEHYAPRTFASADDVVFPAVVKRTNLYAGWGVGLVRDAQELAATLAAEMWAGFPVVFQEYVGAELEYVHQAVVVDGLIVWSCTHEVVIPPASPIRRPNSGETVRIVEIPATERFALQRIIAPLGFSGPVNFNFRRRANGEIALFEINPRFGGSMFRPVSKDVLPEEIRTIIRHATWHEPRG